MFKRSNLLANNLNAITKLKTLKENNKLHSQQCKVHNNHRPIKIIDMQKKSKTWSAIIMEKQETTEKSRNDRDDEWRQKRSKN